ncbi:glycosyltransferase family 39 protein [Catellatospora sichuanensis]|uniref:glycosyltransferase family 39 protein n=1 Tax=Catellatospora sichuanensis TaxID=1969805 RepID=UPI00118422F3|nr:glycosyltransferase family 39 protein [Catellatospora sichuanensis]
MTRPQPHALEANAFGSRLARSLPITIPALVTLLVVLVGHDRRALWRDEYATWWAASLTTDQLQLLLSKVDAVFAPFYLFTRAWVALFGDSLTSLRLPSALAMAAAAGLLGALGRRLFSPGTGLVAGLLFALLPAVSRYGEEARPYAFALAFSVAGALLLLRALEQPGQWRRWVPYALVVAAIGWSHLVALTVLAAYAVAVAGAAGLRSVALRNWMLATAAGGLPVAPLLWLGKRQTGQIGWIGDRGEESVREFVTSIFGSLWIGLAVLALALLSVRLAEPRRRFLLAWALLPPAAVLALTPVINMMLSRYLLFTVPAWVLLAACTLRLLAARVAALTPAARAAAVRAASPVPPATAARAANSHSARSILGGAGSAPAGAESAAGGPGTVRPRRALAGDGPAWAVSLGALAALALLGLPGQVEARTLPAGNQADLRTAAEIMRPRLLPGDAIAYGGESHGGPRTFRRGMTFELRDLDGPKDVFVSLRGQDRGSFEAVECADPAECARGVTRIWLVTSAPDRDLFADMPVARAELLRDEFTTVFAQRTQGVAVALLVREQPAPSQP